jgi:hypothetical protein
LGMGGMSGKPGISHSVMSEISSIEQVAFWSIDSVSEVAYIEQELSTFNI